MSGSEWNRWELHMHTPQTKKNDQFVGKNIEEKWDNFYEHIDQYIDVTKPEKNIKVLGVTDYLSIDNYLRIKEENRLPNSIKLILPNVEMRLNLKGHKQPINFHCIFNSEIVEQLNDRFFSKLKFHDGNRSYSATKNELINLGKSIDSTLLNKDEFLKKGIQNFVIDLSCLQDIFNDKELRENTILAVANKQGDGASGLRGDQFAATKTTIYRFVDAIFSGTNSDILYFLGKKEGDTPEILINKYGKLLPCFHGSDAHKNEKIFEPELRRYCYLKSEISFEGLKQSLTDPEDRVFIGERPSVLQRIIKNPEKIIKSISILNENTKEEWFSNENIKLNPQLNVIIGNKGSGKTAFADIIGLCGNSDRYSDFVFLNKFKDSSSAKHTYAKLLYQNNIETAPKKLSESIEDKSETIKYLPQSYFESLTNEIEKVEKFRVELENVIFQYLPDNEKGDYKFFSKYRESLDVIEKSKIKSLQKELSLINIDIIKLENRSDSQRLKKLKADLKEKEAIILEHLKTEPKKVKVEIKEKAEKLLLEKYENRLFCLNEFQEKVKIKLAKISTIERKTKEFQFEIIKKIVELEKYIEKNSKLIKDIGIDSESLFSYSLNVEILNNKIEGCRFQIDRYNKFLSEESKGSSFKGNSLKGKIYYCEIMISNLISKESVIVQEAKRLEGEYNQWNNKKNILIGEEKNPSEDSLNYLKVEILYVEEDLNNDLIILEKKRIGISKEIMEIKKSILCKFKDSTNLLQKTLDENDEKNLKIVNDFVMDLNFPKTFLAEINQTRISSYRGSYEGDEFLKDLVGSYLKEYSDFSNIETFLMRILESLKYIDKNGQAQKTDLTKIIFNRKNLYDYIFGLEYINNEFDLRLRDKKLDQLSPGERGAVLLIFYLVLDKDISPLLIDQPEDNLDNQSVANVLVPYIKKAKKKRQIIMVTHNPNLAVVSDAELIINVSIDKENNNQFSYFSGGIENRNINKKIQDILEGTPTAFRIRDNKYHNY